MSGEVALLHDAAAAAGRPDSSDTLLEADAIAAALRGRGYRPLVVPVSLDLGVLERGLRSLAPLAVVNLVESLEGRGELVHVVPALLAALGLPFTGCSATALAATSDKLATKRWLTAAEIATPAVLGAASGAGPWIVKATFEHASLGIDDTSVATAAAEARRVLAARRREFGGAWFAERFVPGRELNVALLATPSGPRALPVAEIRFDGFPADKPAIVGYAAKWYPESFEYRHTVRSFEVEPALAERASRLALACWDLFALDGYARVDFRVDAEGMLFVLEVNANPCLAPDAGFAAALAQAGIAFDEAVEWLVADARGRARSAARAP